MKIPIFWHVLNLIFLAPPMDYTCKGEEVVNSSKNLCPCNVPQWDRSTFTETMQTKFELFCENAWIISFSHSMMYSGLSIGGLIFGFLSDKYGRLSAFTISCLVLAMSGCLLSIMPYVTLYIIMRTIEGVGTGGAIVTAYVFCIEYIGMRNREIVTALFHISLNISHITLPGISYLIRHCDQFQLVISIPLYFYVFSPWMILESPKWLLDSGDYDNAILVMEKIAKFNQRPHENIRKHIEDYVAQRSPDSKTKVFFYQIFRHKNISLILLYLSIIYFLCGMGYYGSSQFIEKKIGDIHINVAISGALLFPGTIASIFLLKMLNRRTILIFSIFLSGLFMIITICIPSYYNWIRIIIACICKSFFLISFIVAFLYSVEVFPTSMRNSVLGFLSVLSRVGQTVAPPINSLSENIAGAVFGVFTLIGTGFCFLLPETKDTELPSSLEETEGLTRKRIKLKENISISPNNNETCSGNV